MQMKLRQHLSVVETEIADDEISSLCHRSVIGGRSLGGSHWQGCGHTNAERKKYQVVHGALLRIGPYPSFSYSHFSTLLRI
jgi:hypothetical protein